LFPQQNQETTVAFPSSSDESNDAKSTDTVTPDTIWEQAKDMCVELLFHFHRIALKLALPTSFSKLLLYVYCIGKSFFCRNGHTVNAQ
jgi:hypothetical protein